MIDPARLKPHLSSYLRDTGDLLENHPPHYTGFRGDLDDCGLTDEDRKKGVSIEDLIKEAQGE